MKYIHNFNRLFDLIKLVLLLIKNYAQMRIHSIILKDFNRLIKI